MGTFINAREQCEHEWRFIEFWKYRHPDGLTMTLNNKFYCVFCRKIVVDVTENKSRDSWHEDIPWIGADRPDKPKKKKG